MLLTCPGCHHTFKHFARENTDKVKCFCGTEVPVDNVARFEFTCKQCGKLSYGWTNIEAATIEAGALHSNRPGNDLAPRNPEIPRLK